MSEDKYDPKEMLIYITVGITGDVKSKEELEAFLLEYKSEFRSIQESLNQDYEEIQRLKAESKASL